MTPKWEDLALVSAARLRELEARDGEIERLSVAGSMQLRELRAEVARLKAALEFYGDRATWRPRGAVGASRSDQDRGLRARRALGVPT